MHEEILESLLDSFDIAKGRYKDQQVELAVTLKEQITPRLIAVLEEVATNPAHFSGGDREVHLYAAALLAYFQEPAAHLPIIRAFSIPQEYLDGVWGDLEMERLAAVLVQTSGGSLDAIKAMILDEKVDDYVRGAAVDALTYAIARGSANREEVQGFLREFLTEKAGENDVLWQLTIAALIDIHPDGAMDVIRRAYDEGLAPEDFASLEEVEAAVGLDKEEFLKTWRAQVEEEIPRDVEGYLRRGENRWKAAELE
ncbi:DUF1186 domain-containing protein [Geomesophilobacter sediminis]|uniref:DUF1186 domain-containing protein n=1 Tax=Geomesophilobacter sediminis TaxID=2798584 RepID=A0A8J7LUF1_9BACT|nr:DUF1186 domain-containing protein [Geomesophilobacter sediminis]MBJ6724574.1 DUF1186 domain-containing protein [Geomesophilobacter sediminis]